MVCDILASAILIAVFTVIAGSPATVVAQTIQTPGTSCSDQSGVSALWERSSICPLGTLLWQRPAFQFGPAIASCASGTAGMVEWASSALKYCDGSTWVTIGSNSNTFSAGTVSAPGWAVTGDSNTGLYAPAADVLSITAGGKEIARFGNNATASLEFAGGVTGSPGVITEAAAGSDTDISIKLSPKGAGKVLFGTLGAYDTTNNFMGVGTATPAAELQGGASAAAWTTNGIALRAHAGTPTTSSGTVAKNHISVFGTPTVAASSSTTFTDAATLAISGAPTNGTNVTLTHAWAEYVAAGNIYSGGNLHEAASGFVSRVTLRDVYAQNGFGTGDTDGGNIILMPGTANGAGAPGGVGIGVTLPSATLEVDTPLGAAGDALVASSPSGYAAITGNAGSGYGLVATSAALVSGYFTSSDATNTFPTLVVQRNGASTADLLEIQDDSDNPMDVVTSAGTVGIGTASPISGTALEVYGNIDVKASGYVNFGTSDGSSGYGFNDSSGTRNSKIQTAHGRLFRRLLIGD
jgi:hypothetical protein